MYSEVALWGIRTNMRYKNIIDLFSPFPCFLYTVVALIMISNLLTTFNYYHSSFPYPSVLRNEIYTNVNKCVNKPFIQFMEMYFLEQNSKRAQNYQCQECLYVINDSSLCVNLTLSRLCWRGTMYFCQNIKADLVNSLVLKYEKALSVLQLFLLGRQNFCNGSSVYFEKYPHLCSS